MRNLNNIHMKYTLVVYMVYTFPFIALNVNIYVKQKNENLKEHITFYINVV